MRAGPVVLCLLVSGILLAPGCGKGGTAKLPDTDGAAMGDLTLLGRWRWVMSEGGIAGIRRTPEETGTTWVLEFQEDRFSDERSGEPPVERSYRIEPRPVAWQPKEFLPAIITGEEPELLDANAVLLSENVIDGFFHRFVRDRAP